MTQMTILGVAKLEGIYKSTNEGEMETIDCGMKDPEGVAGGRGSSFLHCD